MLSLQVRRRTRTLVSLLRESLRDEERDYTRGSIRRALVLLAIPMILEMSMEAIFAVVDIFFVARLGPAAVSTVGITEAMMTILYAVSIGIAMATTAMVARRVGERRRRAAAAVAGQSLWVAALLATLIGVIGGWYAPELLTLMGASDEVITTGSRYTTVMFAGSASIFYLFLFNAIFRGAGDATIAMRSLWIANAINIVLDPCLIFGLGPFPAMGLTGAAVATTIGRTVGIVYQLMSLRRTHGRLRMTRHALRLRWPMLRRLLRVSAGGVGQYLIVTSSWVLVMRVLTVFGTQAVAGFTIAMRVIYLVFLPAWGLGNAAATLVGQNLGAKQPERAVRSAWQATWANVAFMALVAIVFVGVPEFLLRGFTKDTDVIAIGAMCLRIVGAGLPIAAIGMILTQGINGAGDTATPTWLNFIAYWLLQIPLAWWFAQWFAEPGVAWALLISEVTFSILAIIVFRRGRWQRQDV
ncbi:MAG: MATE family efflux transporter [Pseudomonadota bacterium]